MESEKRVLVDFGQGRQEIAVPGNAVVLEWTDPLLLADPMAAVEMALAHPVGSPPLVELARSRKKVVVAFDDPLMPARIVHTVLPSVLGVLDLAGVSRSDIRLLSANGTHPKYGSRDLERYLGADLFRTWAADARVLSHDCVESAGLVGMGRSRFGDLVEVNRLVQESELLVFVGSVRVGPNGGYTGTNVAVGLSGIRCASATYGFPVFAHPDSCHGNPASSLYQAHKQAINERIEEVTGRRVFYVNCLAGTGGRVAAVVAGYAPEVNWRSWAVADQFCVAKSPDVDVLVVGIPQQMPYDTSDNPLLALYAVSAAPRLWRGRPLLREGGIAIGVTTSDGTIDTERLPSYPEVIDLFSESKSVEELDALVPRYWYGENYTRAYAEGRSYHATHPLWLLNGCDYLLKRASRIIVAGTRNPEAFRRLGCVAAADFSEAWRLVRDHFDRPRTVVLPSYWSRPLFAFDVSS